MAVVIPVVEEAAADVLVLLRQETAGDTGLKPLLRWRMPIVLFCIGKCMHGCICDTRYLVCRDFDPKYAPSQK